MPALPDDPFRLCSAPPFQPAARREMRLFGAPAELLWLPQRRSRPGLPRAGQPAFRKSRIAKILSEETVWRGDGGALTPNPYPFAERQAIVWAEAPIREPDLGLLELVLRFEEHTGGALLINSTGAAASFARAHAHLLAEPNAFLEELPREPFDPDFLEPVAGVDIVRLAPPVPILAVGVRGAARDRARAIHQLLQRRTTAAFNVVSQNGVSWVVPRTIETPAPEFPQALGAAELWGRWCFNDEQPFEEATPEKLEAVLTRIGHPR